MAYTINGLKYPATDRIKSRNTTLNRSMANTLMHRFPCSQEIEVKWKSFFSSNTCAYCGKPATHLDHLYSLIDEKNKKRPSGYGTEPGNLVPCCSKCNQPKGKMDWETFMRSEKCKHVGSVKNSDPILAMEERIQNIKDFQKDMPAKKMSFTPSMMAEWDKLVVDFEIILKNVEEKLNVWAEQLHGVLNSAKVVSTKRKTTGTGGGSRGKYTEAQKYSEAAYYLGKGVNLEDIEEICLGIKGSGSTAKNHLNSLGIETSRSSAHRGLLMKSDIDTEISKATGVFKNTLEEIKKRGL